MVLHHLPAPGAGGLEGQVHDLCSGLLERGIDVRVVCRSSLYLPAPNVPLQGRATALPVAAPMVEHATPFLELWHTSRELGEAEELTAYDVVHVQSHYGFHTALDVVDKSGPRPALVTTFHLTALGGMLRLHELAATSGTGPAPDPTGRSHGSDPCPPVRPFDSGLPPGP